MVECSVCGKVTEKPVNESWHFGYCPQCVSCKELPTMKLDNILFSKNYNPVDLYWHLLTIREMAMEARAK